MGAQTTTNQAFTTGSSSLKIFATGGTFDKHYDEASGTLGFTAGSHLEKILTRARVTHPHTLDVLPLLDSNDMDADYRADLLRRCREAAEQRFLVIHGTDTIVETARLLAAAGLKKTIVLTGAMVPYSISESDALFNLGYAMAIANTMPVGVYVAMNGCCFTWDNVVKNREKGQFEVLR